MWSINSFFRRIHFAGLSESWDWDLGPGLEKSVTAERNLSRGMVFQWPGVSHHLLPTTEIARSVHVFYMFIRPVPPYAVLLPRMRKITEVELALVVSNLTLIWFLLIWSVTQPIHSTEKRLCCSCPTPVVTLGQSSGTNVGVTLSFFILIYS